MSIIVSDAAWLGEWRPSTSRRSMRNACCGFAVLLAAGLAGCSATEHADEANTKSTAPLTSEPAAEDKPAAITLKTVSFEQLQAFLASQAGRIVVLDVWSTSCQPCVEELPNLVALREEYADQPVVCVTLNIDYTGAAGTTAEDAREDVLEMLRLLKVDVENFLSATPDRQLYKTPLFQENKVYAIPAIFVFDASGNVVGKFGGDGEDESPYVAVKAAVDGLLKDS